MTSTTPEATTTESEAPVGYEEAPAAADQPSGEGQAPATQKEAVKRAYSEATTALREAHRDEFNADVQQRVKDYGFTWEPRPTAEQKALAEVQRLLREHPALAEEIKGSA